MPRIKSSPTASPRKNRPARSSSPRTLHPKKKTKSILVDVIEDELAADGDLSSGLGADFKDPEKGTISKKDKDDVFLMRPEADEEIDRQKKFFSEIVSEMKTKATPTGRGGEARKNPKSKRSLGLYRRLVIKFIILVAILAAVVAYFSFSKLTVAIDLKGETINDNLLLKIADASTQATSTSLASSSTDPRELVYGTIKEIKTDVAKTYPASGETYLGDQVIGQVRIINNYNKSQALVATTRLLSPDHKLFRIKNAVNVPAGGEVTVDIYADKPSADLAIDPTTFTIPGLWLGLQDKIYARSDAKFVYEQKVQKYVNVSDLERATKDISDTLLSTAKEQASANIAPGSSWLYLADESPTVVIDAKNGSKQDEFTAKASGRIVAVYFPKDQAAKLAAAKLNLLIPDDKELTEFKPENISYSLENYDAVSKTATVKATFTGVMALKGDAQVINPSQLVNLSAEQIATYLKSQPEIKDYTLSFSPSFIKKAPSLVDRISIIVNK